MKVIEPDLNYREIIVSCWDKYQRVNDKAYDDSFFYNKYKDVGITSRKEWFIVKNELFTNKEKLFEKHGISCIGGNLMKPGSGKGPKDKRHKGKKRDESDHIIEKFELEKSFAFNYDDMLSCEPDDNKEWLYKINNISFERERLMYGELRDKYLSYQSQYIKDQSNGNLKKIEDIARRLSTYILKNNLNMKDNYSDGGVICNIAIIISEYIQTGILDTNIKRFENYTVKQLNKYYNTYVLFILLNIFSCKQRRKRMSIHGFVVREKWYINLFRRRITNCISRTTCVVPSFDRDIYGNIILYCDSCYDGNDELDEEVV